MDPEGSTLDEGRFGRVRDVEHATGRVFIDLDTGYSAWFVPNDIEDWKPGDVGFFTDTTSEKVESSLWKAGHEVGQVKSVRDVDVVIECDGKLRGFLQRDPNPFIVGQVVRIEANGSPGPVVSEEPIGLVTISHEDSFDVESLITDAADNDVTMDMVGGSDLLKRRARNLVRVALDPEDRIGKIGVRPVKGILFSGPSGTGKTFLARALASETSATFYNISGPVIAGELVGQSERRLREIFDHAHARKPSILFFDEIDSLYSQRGDGSNEHTNRLVGQFLSLLDGYKQFHQVLVIATTNLPSALDDALLRPGRLSHKLSFAHPDEADRFQILRAQTQNAKFEEGENVALDDLAEKTHGWTAADLAAIWTEAGILASLDRRTSLIREDVIAAVENVQRVDQKRNRRKEK